MNQEKEMTEQESMLIIEQMIHAAKQEQKDDGKGWIIWGWALFLVSILTIINLYQNWFSTYYFWTFFGYFTIVMMVYSIVRRFFFNKSKVKTYTREIFEKLNLGFFISLIFIIFAMNLHKVEPLAGFAFLIDLYGFWILIYGATLNFKPSMIAAFIVWAFGYAALFTNSFERIMLYHAAAVLIGYIIPGHIANREFNKTRR